VKILYSSMFLISVLFFYAHLICVYFKMINLTAMLSIVNFVFIVVFYAMRIEMNKTRLHLHNFKEFINQFNLFYICNKTRVIGYTSWVVDQFFC
jgi:hypothetical protein